MFRPTLSRRTLAGGVAVAAVASLALGSTSASAGTLQSGTHSVRAQSGPASDIALSIVQQSPLLSGPSGPYIVALLSNPSSLPAGPAKNEFAAAADNAAGAVIGAATPLYINHQAIAPGGQQAYVFTVPAGTDHVAITDPSGAQANEIADPLSATPVTAATDSSGYVTLSGTITNASAYAQNADVTVLFKNAAGQIIGFDKDGSVSPNTIPASSSAAFSDFLSPTQVAGVASYAYIVDGKADSSIGTYIDTFNVQLPAYVGKQDTFDGFLSSIGGVNTSGRAVELIARTAGVTTVLARATTTANGAFTFHATPSANAQLSVLHPSDSGSFGTDTGDVYFPLTATLTVNHLKAKTLTAKKHKAFQITGTFPGFPGEKAYLELRDSHGKYKVVTFTHVSGNGSLTFKGSKLVQSKAGKYTYRVEVMAQGFHKDISSTFTVKVS